MGLSPEHFCLKHHRQCFCWLQSRHGAAAGTFFLTLPAASPRTLAFPRRCPFFGARAKTLAQLPLPGLLWPSLVWSLRCRQRVVGSRTVFLKEASSTLERVMEKACSCLLLPTSTSPDPVCSPQVCSPGSDLIPQLPQALLLLICGFPP